MKFNILFREIFISLNSFRIRSLLTLLGVSIGIAAVFLTINITQHIKHTLTTELASIRKMIIITPRPRKISGVRKKVTYNTKLQETDLAIINNIRSVKYVAPLIVKNTHAHSSFDNINTNVIGTTSQYLLIRNLAIDKGVIFNKDDIKQRRQVILIGKTIETRLFNNTSALNKTIKLNNQNYQIIGILEEQGQSVDGIDRDNVIIAPISTIRDNFYNNYAKHDSVDYILATVTKPDLINSAKLAIEKTLIHSHKANPKKITPFLIKDRIKEVNSFQYIFKTIASALLIIGITSLVISGVGMSTLMFMSVSERSAEIALRKAIGATDIEILWQIVLEAIILSFFGGILGSLIGIGATLIFSQFFKIKFINMLLYLIPCTLAASMVGAISGIIPAYNTLKISPVDAMNK